MGRTGLLATLGLKPAPGGKGAASGARDGGPARGGGKAPKRKPQRLRWDPQDVPYGTRLSALRRAVVVEGNLDAEPVYRPPLNDRVPGFGDHRLQVAVPGNAEYEDADLVVPLHVRRAKLRVAAVDASMNEGGPLPQLKHTVGGLVGDDQVQVRLRHEVTERSPANPGGYPIVPELVGFTRGVAENYEVPVLQPALLRVAPKKAEPKTPESLLKALGEARGRCLHAVKNQSGTAGVVEFSNLKSDADEIAEELETPSDMEPGKAMRKADRIIVALDKLTQSVVRDHYAKMKAALEQRLQALLAQARKTGVEADGKAVEGIRRRLQVLPTRREIDPSDASLEKDLHEVGENVHHDQAAQTTRREKEPVLDEARARHAGTPTGTPLTELVERMVPGRITDLPLGPLGEAHMNYGGSTWPAVKLLAADGKVRFAPTQASEGKGHACTVKPMGVYDIAEIVSVKGNSVSVMAGEQLQTFRDIKGARKAWEGRMLRRGISKHCYKEIELREIEHLVDFSHAFQIAAGRLAAEVNGLSGQAFAGEDAALSALIDRLSDALALVPGNPRDLPAWQQRVQHVTSVLGEFSSDRDKEGTHSPAGNAAREEGDGIVIEPVFKAASLATSAIVSLARVDRVFNGLKPAQERADEWQLHAVRRITGKTPLTDFHDAVNGKLLLSENVPDGVEVTIEAEPVGDRVWVGATAGAVRIADDGSRRTETPVYFEMSTENLA